MGDGGSHLLGSFLAAASLMAAPSLNPHLAPVAAIPVVLMLIPDFRHGVRGRSRATWRAAARSWAAAIHTSHRLVALGIGERRAVLVLYALAAGAGGVALGLRLLPRASPGACRSRRVCDGAGARSASTSATFRSRTRSGGTAAAD
jgi:UDP-GlcNAc:undecaprenyl-phosphate GlcNAc-1-phosphate transferase